MPRHAYLLALPNSTGTQTRAVRLYDELCIALGHMESATMKAWGKRAATRLLLLAGQRVGGLAKLATLIVRSGGGELLDLFVASRQRRLLAHIGDRTAAAIDGTVGIGREGFRLIVEVSRALLRDPKRTAPNVLGALLGFSAGSGGLDGNGGIPDLDLLGGIGLHRSPLTHTIIAGIVAEGLLLAIADLAAEVHGHLPERHDPVWDNLARIGRPLTESLAIGTSTGLAYHFLVDALIQTGAYHDLPVNLPSEAHQALFAANGVAEGQHAFSKTSRHIHADYSANTEPSTGRRVVDAVGELASKAAGALAGSVKRIAFKKGKA
jgi:hypothetical protein